MAALAAQSVSIIKEMRKNGSERDREDEKKGVIVAIVERATTYKSPSNATRKIALAANM